MATKETVITTVTMEDGRKVDFPGKRQLQKSSAVSVDGVGTVTLDFVNGATRTFTLPTALLMKFALHGAEQKLGDELAGLKTDTGADADIDDKVLAIEALIERLNAGNWSVGRESSGMAGTSVLIQALVKYQNGKKSVEEIKKFLAGKTHAEKLALRNSAALKPIVAEIEAAKAQKATASIDTEALLAGLDEADGAASE